MLARCALLLLGVIALLALVGAMQPARAPKQQVLTQA